MNAEIPDVPFERSVFAITTYVDAAPPFVIKAFEPLMRYAFPSRTATVVIPPASLPEPGSVRHQAPITLPVAIEGIYLCA
jgi:hypothetical protein